MEIVTISTLHLLISVRENKKKIMTDKQLTLHNLKLLRDYWAKLSFNPRMDFFGRIMDEVIGSLTIGGINPCGTDCCALGKAPEVAGLEI